MNRKIFQFEHDGRTLELRFRHKAQRVHLQDPFVKDVKHAIVSRWPYTTVDLYDISPANAGNDKFVATATVGCRHNEVYTPAKGNEYALRLLGTNLKRTMGKIYDRDFRRAMWDAYTHRPRATKVERLQASLKALTIRVAPTQKVEQVVQQPIVNPARLLGPMLANIE